MPKAPHKILIGFGEAVAAPEVAFSLHEYGYQLVAFVKNVDRCALRHLPFIELEEIPDPNLNADTALDTLAQLLDRLDVDGLMPLDDESLWLITQLSESGKIPRSVTTLCADVEAAKVALDKSEQIENALAAGINVPETLIAISKDNVSDWASFPCIVKSANAISVGRRPDGKQQLVKSLSTFCMNRSELLAWFDDNGGNDKFVVQPLIRGEGEGIFGHRSKTGVVGWSGHKRIRMLNPHGSGSSACEEKKPDPDICKKIEMFLTGIDWTGLFMMEFLRGADDTLWFIELNGRAWGSMALARRNGFEYPVWMAQEKFDGSLTMDTHTDAPQGIVLRHLGRDILHMLHVLRGPRSEFYREGWPNRIATVAKVLRPQHGVNFYNYNSKYKMFFIQEAIVTVLNAFRKLSGT